MNKFLIGSLLCETLLYAQTGREAVPATSVHQYSGISPVSPKNDKLHTFNLQGHARIVRLADAKLIADFAPYPEAHWDNSDNDLMWLMGNGGGHSQNRIETWRPSSGKYETAFDYKGRFTNITTGATTDISYDDWEAFWAPVEHQICAVDLRARKTYCLDYNAPDPVNKLGPTKDVDYVAVTPRDSKSGLHYVLMMASPAMAVFSVDEAAGTLRWIVRPEVVAPLMGSRGKGNNDGNCDPGEPCITTPHGDIYTSPDGQVYFQSATSIEVQLADRYVCESGQSFMRINAGLKMTTPENAFGRSGGGLRYLGPDFHCGGTEEWSSQHTGCARWGQLCVVSFSTPPPAPGNQTAPKKEEIWLVNLDGEKRIGNSNSSAEYWATPRAAMSMDGSLVIYDSDHGTNGASHALYALPTGNLPVPRPRLSSRPER